MLKTSDFDFKVPPELIAHEPCEKRDHSRLMVIDRKDKTIEHKHFFDVVDYLNPGDLLVLNDTKVLPANLVGKKAEGGTRVEVLLVKPITSYSLPITRTWECLVKPGKKLSVGSKVFFGENEVVGTVLEKTESGEQIIAFEGDLEGFMRRSGEVPLPPYIKKMTNPSAELRINDQFPMSNEGVNSEFDLKERYQTVYAEKEGASAAPTAGLHFTPELLEKIKAKGVNVACVTLHTGLATFKPVYAEHVEEHKMYSESFEVPEETIELLKKAKRVIAVGTTSVRTLEAVADEILTAKTCLPAGKAQRREGKKGIKGETNLFIYPGYKFKIVDAIITNFHWPRTSLIMLVSAFAGKEFIMQAYQEAIEQKYRFFSFGDAMVIV